MRNQPRQLIIASKDNTVRTGRTTAVNLSAAENRELVVRARDGKVEALVVVVFMRIAAGFRPG